MRTPVIDMEVVKDYEKNFSALFVKELFLAFDNDLEKNINDLKAAIAKKDRKELASSAHALKGSSANVGALRLSNATKSLEQLANEEADFDMLRDHLSLVFSEATKVKALIDKNNLTDD